MKNQVESQVDEVFDPQTPRRFLHVLNGDATRVKLEQSDVPGTFSVWADILHEGPVPGSLAPDELREVRARFLAGTDRDYEAVLAHLSDWDSGLASFADQDEVVLWFEHDLFDQLALVHHLDFYARQRLDRPLALICIGQYAGVDRFIGLGQLTPDQLGSLLDTRQPVTEEQLALGGAAWAAFRGPDPTAIERVLAADTSPLPFLAAALRRQLQEYPSVENGLPRTERQIVATLAEGPKTPRGLFRAMYDLEESPFLGDSSFWTRVQLLAAGAHPLVELEVQKVPGLALPEGEVRITGAGREVLAGRADWIHLAGIDRWIGGVHLVGSHTPWRWDERGGRLAS